MTPADLTVRRLADGPSVIDGLAAIMRQAWPGWYGPGGAGDARADLVERQRCRGLPIGFVALDGAVPVGTVALGAVSHGAEPGEPCWLIGLVTAPGARGRGIGSSLVAAAMAEAAATGVASLHATTRTAAGLLQRLGWRPVRHLADGHVVLRIALC